MRSQAVRAAAELAESWRPWRSYAVQHLWAYLEESHHDQPFLAPDADAPRLSHIVGSPIGRLLLTGDGHALTGLWMLDALTFSGRHSARVISG